MSRKDSVTGTKPQTPKASGSIGAAAQGVAALPRLQQQAMALFQAGRPRLALKACHQILALQPNRPDVLSFAGMIAGELGDMAQAAELYRRALTLRPDFVEAQYNLATALQGLGRLEEAVAAYRRAVALKPDLAPAHHNLGNVLRSLGQLEAAAESYRQAFAIAATPNSAGDLGIVLQQLGHLDEATAAYRQGLALQPDSTSIFSNLVNVLMEKRDPAGAVAACDQWLARLPRSVEAIALKGLALNELGETAAARFLLDFDRFVKIIDFESAPGYGSLADFNAALVAHVEGHPTLKVPPKDHPTYHHDALQITEELLAEPKGPMAALEHMMHQAIADYLASVPREPTHPFLAGFPKRWTLRSWATRLAGQGNLVPHIHFDGYLSGVYYPLLPKVVAEAGQGAAGWFELGGPPDTVRCEAPPLARRIQPKEGRMLLFPGYFFHNTVPFHSDERRISVAFDLVPEPE